MNKNELTILIAWYNSSDERERVCFEENRKTFQQYNPEYEVVTVISPYQKSNFHYHYIDITLLKWYADNKANVNAERFLLVDWACWCNINVKEYFKYVWDSDVVAPCVKYPERDTWSWFGTIAKLPEQSRIYATGIVPFCGILVSAAAMNKISSEIFGNGYDRVISELRFATVATLLGYDPIPNPVCSRPLTWKKRVPFDLKYGGLHYPRTTLTSSDSLISIKKYLFNNSDSIPKIIHQTWKDEYLAKKNVLWSETWKSLHPDWDYILWTDEMNREFIATFFPEFLIQYDSYQYEIQRVDAVRYFILFKIGGLFIDLDFECLKNIEDLLSEDQCIFGLEPTAHCELYKKQMIICNAFMASKPNDDFLLSICRSLSLTGVSQNNFINDILSATGPFALTEVYNSYSFKHKIKLLPSSTIYPLTVKETRRLLANDVDHEMQGKIDNAYAIHHFSGSWL